MNPLALAAAMFSIAPVPRRYVPDADAGNAALALRWLPLVGAVLGAFAGLAALVFWRGDGAGSPFVGAVVAVGALAVLTRGLHLDGLADVADALGSRRPADEALEIMRRSDIGPFGVAAALLVSLLQIAALTTVFAGVGRWQGVALLAVVVGAARLAAVIAARPSVPSARPGGFGDLVAGSAPLRLQLALAPMTLVAAGLLTAAAGFDARGIAWTVGALIVGQAVSGVFCWHVVRRIGGVTGDVLGALIEIAATATLLVLAGVVSWHGSL